MGIVMKIIARGRLFENMNDDLFCSRQPNNKHIHVQKAHSLRRQVFLKAFDGLEYAEKRRCMKVFCIYSFFAIQKICIPCGCYTFRQTDGGKDGFFVIFLILDCEKKNIPPRKGLS